MIQGKAFTAKTFLDKQILNRFFDLQVAREYGWTEEDILQKTSQSFYDDAVLLMQKEAFFRKKAADEQKKQKS